MITFQFPSIGEVFRAEELTLCGLFARDRRRKKTCTASVIQIITENRVLFTLGFKMHLGQKRHVAL